MLNSDDVNNEEERIRKEIFLLDDESKKRFYNNISSEIKDPDTYAVLNWLFITGLHHFYLKKYTKASINFSLFLISFILMFSDIFLLGIGIFIAVSIMEVNQLFYSQIIVQDYNNKILKKSLEKINKSK
ncbi:MAG: TM2 domain-containing protein [Campylobacteraceae bacterium]|nr:TM2 domain-containing protein [Campylobacteraceae bacterium]